MLNVKIRVPELFANVHQDLQETHLSGVMIIPVQLTPVVQMLIVKLKEIELFVDAGMDMRVIRLFNVR